MTNAEITQLYWAQAIAANTFLEYAQSVYSNHTGYDVCSTACCQVYDPAVITQKAIDATAGIFYTVGGEPATVIMFYEPAPNSYNYMWGTFSSDCDNQGTLTHATEPALVGVSCTDIADGDGGHRYGLCQQGAAYLARSGYNAGNILNYCYYSSDAEFCLLD